jgi:hypothetical protein
MATDNEIDQVERRAALAAQVATLTERSINTQEHLVQFSKSLVDHAEDEERMLTQINASIVEVKDQINERFDNEIGPIKKDMAEFKSTMRVLIVIGTFVGTCITLVWEHLDKWLFH